MKGFTSFLGVSALKKAVRVLCLVLLTAGFGFAQEEASEKKWDGTVIFSPGGLIAGEKAVVGATHIIWTPFTRRIGLPVGATAFYQKDGVGGVGLVAGIEIVPVGGVSKIGVFSGLLLDVKAGGMLLIGDGYDFSICGDAHIGYKLITSEGFVFSPAIGTAYTESTGFGFTLRFAMGFAY